MAGGVDPAAVGGVAVGGTGSATGGGTGADVVGPAVGGTGSATGGGTGAGGGVTDPAVVVTGVGAAAGSVTIGRAAAAGGVTGSTAGGGGGNSGGVAPGSTGASAATLVAGAEGGAWPPSAWAVGILSTVPAFRVLGLPLTNALGLPATRMDIIWGVLSAVEERIRLAIWLRFSPRLTGP